MEKQMECKEVQKRMRSFVTDEMDLQDAATFIAHVEKCKECREDLSIEYLAVVGMQRLDEAGNFDLDKELDEKIQKKLEKIALKKQIHFMIMAIAIAGAISAGYFLALMIYM